MQNIDKSFTIAIVQELQDAVRQHYLRSRLLNYHLRNLPLDDLIRSCAEVEEFEEIMRRFDEQERIENKMIEDEVEAYHEYLKEQAEECDECDDYDCEYAQARALTSDDDYPYEIEIMDLGEKGFAFNYVPIHNTSNCSSTTKT